MQFNFHNDWKNQGWNGCNVLSLTLFRIWACSWSIGIEILNFVFEIEF